MTNLDKAIWLAVKAIADKSNCTKRKVGAIIFNTKLNQIVGKGCNLHIDNICDCDTTSTAIHAEVNAINTMKEDYPREDLIMFCNHQLCTNCSKESEKVVKEIRMRSQH